MPIAIILLAALLAAPAVMPAATYEIRPAVEAPTALRAPGAVPGVSLFERAKAIDGSYGGECVYFVQSFLGQFKDCDEVNCLTKTFRGNAADIQPNADAPAIGRAVLFDYKLGHAAVIVGLDGDELVLAESNFKMDGRVSVGRVVSSTDPRIRGYFDFNE